MLEEIKKELLKLNIHECDIEDVFEILDKYKDKEIKFENGSSKFAIVKVPKLNVDNIKNYNQPDYKSAFNELFNFYATDLKDMYSKNDVMILGRLKDLIKKYNLGGE